MIATPSPAFSPLLAVGQSVGVVLLEGSLSSAVWSVLLSAQVSPSSPGQPAPWVPLSPAFLTVPPSLAGTPGNRLIALAQAPSGVLYKVELSLASGTPSGLPTLAFFLGVQPLQNASVIVIDGQPPPLV
jgi:hypothetical protein